MDTVFNLIEKDIQDLKENIKNLLTNYSSLYRWKSDSDGIFIAAGDFRWNQMSVDGKRLQSKLYEFYNGMLDLFNVLLSEQPKQTIKELDKNSKIILAVIEQNGTFWDNNITKYLNESLEALDNQLSLLQSLYSEHSNEHIFVPDTNALLTNPDLESWRFDGVNTFTIALTTSVLSELDSLKINHRVEEVRKKSMGLIRRIKSYRNRGRITEGVPLVRNVSSIVSIAVEPNFNNTLKWLDKENVDDRIIASLLEIMRKYLNSTVVLITSDINLQNKAEFARIPFIEPPSKP